MSFLAPSQIVSMPLSLLSLCLAASKAYYHQRMEPLADPDPPFVWSLLLVLPLYFFITSITVLTWAVIFAHVRGLVIPMVVLSILNKWLLIKVFHTFSALSSLTTGVKEEDAREKLRTMHDLKQNSIFTSVLSPCVVGSHKVNLLALMGLSNSLCLGLWLQCTVMILQQSPLNIEENPPVTYCFQDDQKNITQYIGHSAGLWFRVCGTNCEPFIRTCGDNEDSLHHLLSVLIPNLNVMLFLSCLLCCLLQVLSNYANVFRLTHWLTLFKGGYLHRSLLCNLAESGDHVELAKILGMVRDSSTKQAVNRPDSR